METLRDFKYYSFSTQLALCSFLLGTLLFASYFFLPNTDGIIIVGLFFVLFASFFNAIVVLHLGYQLLTNPEEREHIIIKIAIVLANIPIAFLYFYIIVHSFNSQQLF
jgi:hypothetical protein